MKRILLLFLSACLLLSAAACGKEQPAESTTEPNTAAPTDLSEPNTAEEESSSAAAVDLSAYPVNLLGQSVKAYEENRESVWDNTFFNGYGSFEIRDLFPDVHYLSSAVEEVNGAQEIKADAVFEVLYTASDAEVYPKLKTGLYYKDYAAAFAVSPCEYREEFCYYAASFSLDVHGEQATVTLFFYDLSSPCNCLMISIKDEMKFSTLNIKEKDRDQYPVLYIGRSALAMQRQYGDAFAADLTEYDTELRKHVYLGIKTDDPAKPISQNALVKGVNVYTDQWEAAPGIRVGDSAPGAGFTAYQGLEADSYYYDTFFIGGYFVETYVYITDDNFSGFSFLCKQLYDD